MGKQIDIDKLRTELLAEFANGNLAHNVSRGKHYIQNEEYVDKFLGRFKPDELKIIKSTPDMLKIMFQAFGKDISKGVKCEYCDKIVTPDSCSGFMPRFKGDIDKPIILCKSILCMSSYLTYETED